MSLWVLCTLSCFSLALFISQQVPASYRGALFICEIRNPASAGDIISLHFILAPLYSDTCSYLARLLFGNGYKLVIGFGQNQRQAFVYFYIGRTPCLFLTSPMLPQLPQLALGEQAHHMQLHCIDFPTARSGLFFLRIVFSL